MWRGSLKVGCMSTKRAASELSIRTIEDFSVISFKLDDYVVGKKLKSDDCKMNRFENCSIQIQQV